VCASSEDHDDWNAGARGETPLQRADRAYGEILQEVRVAQTGVQILFAFLLALAFQARFGSTTSFQRPGASDSPGRRRARVVRHVVVRGAGDKPRPAPGA
jgi:hypothetical protein